MPAEASWATFDGRASSAASADDARLPRRVLVACIPSALLCVVALEGLTPWKGGGFGMFSTVDSQAERFVRLSVTTEGGETFVVPIPAEYHRQVDRARLLPWAPATSALAADLLPTERLRRTLFR
jgi:hypothetical protein